MISFAPVMQDDIVFSDERNSQPTEWRAHPLPFSQKGAVLSPSEHRESRAGLIPTDDRPNLDGTILTRLRARRLDVHRRLWNLNHTESVDTLAIERNLDILELAHLGRNHTSMGGEKAKQGDTANKQATHHHNLAAAATSIDLAAAAPSIDLATVATSIDLDAAATSVDSSHRGGASVVGGCTHRPH